MTSSFSLSFFLFLFIWLIFILIYEIREDGKNIERIRQMDLFTVLFFVLALLYFVAIVRCLNSCFDSVHNRTHGGRAYKKEHSYDDEYVRTPDYSNRYDKNKTPMKSSLKKKRSPSTERIRKMRHVKFEDEYVTY